MPRVRIELPFHLRALAGVAGHEVALEVPEGASFADMLDALESRFPALCGTVRDHASGQRRAYLRFFACGQDVSFEPLCAALPDAVSQGLEPFLILGAVSGGAV